MISSSTYYAARQPPVAPEAAEAPEVRRCSDCGVKIISGKRCAAHTKLHVVRTHQNGASNRVNDKIITPGWLEEIFARDLARGMTVREISKHRGVSTERIVEILGKLHRWLLAQPIDSVNTFAGLALARAVEDFNCRVALK